MRVYAAAGGEYSDYRVYAIFATEELARSFVERRDTYADRVETHTLYEALPGRESWYIVERMRGGPTVRRQLIVWEFEGPQFEGQRRKSWNFSRWQYGERAWGMDERAVEKAWTEQHPEEAS